MAMHNFTTMRADRSTAESALTSQCHPSLASYVYTAAHAVITFPSLEVSLTRMVSITLRTWSTAASKFCCACSNVAAGLRLLPGAYGGRTPPVAMLKLSCNQGPVVEPAEAFSGRFNSHRIREVMNAFMRRGDHHLGHLIHFLGPCTLPTLCWVSTLELVGQNFGH
jgi:hypothetical protein